MRLAEIVLPPLTAATIPGALAVLFAQDPVTGVWSGWSAFGLAGLILCWLFFRHLPDKDRQAADKDGVHRQLVKELNEAHIAQIREIVASNSAIDKERRGDFQAALTAVVSHCDREQERLIEELKRQGAEATLALRDVRDTLEELRLTRANSEQHRHEERGQS